MKPPRAITVVLFVLLLAACGNHNTVQIGPPDSGATVNRPSTEQPNNNTAPNLNIPTQECDPNYTPCVPIATDVDCEGKGGNGPKYVRGPVRVIGTDIYGLDRDGNGIGCE